MERRDFIKLGAAAGVGGAAMAAKPSGLVNDGMLAGGVLAATEPPDMPRYLDKIDRGLSRIDEWRMEDYLALEGCPSDGDWGAENKFVRDSIKTLYLTGMFGDLPAESRAHPGMQDRIWDHMGTMDDAVFGTLDRLKAQAPAETAALKRFLTEKPSPAMRLGERLDGQAKEIGVSVGRRLQMRSQFAQTNFRLTHQDPMLIYNEYTSKVEKLAAQNGLAEEFKRRLTAKAGEKLFWEKPQDLAALAEQWEGLESGAVAGAASGKRRYPRTLTTGAIMMGVGAAAGLAGLAAGPGAFMAVSLTVGSILVFVGLIVVIVGGIRRSQIDKRGY
jgi:hypothetical protein